MTLLQELENDVVDARGEIMKRHRLVDDGQTMIRIMEGKKEVGRTYKHADGWRALIHGFEATAATAEDAAEQAGAAYHGQHVSMIRASRGGIHQHTRDILLWLKDNAAAHDGSLVYGMDDLARLLGWPKPNSALGQIMSRTDLACYLARLPALSCAAEKPFDGAYQTEHHGWHFPVQHMCQVAKAHRWTSDDFDRVLREANAIISGNGHTAWELELAKHEARIKQWAEQIGRARVGSLTPFPAVSA